MKLWRHFREMSTFRLLSVLGTAMWMVALLAHDWFLLAIAAISTLDALGWAIWESKQ